MTPVARPGARNLADLESPYMAYIGDSVEQGSSVFSGSSLLYGGDSYPAIVGIASGQRIRTIYNAGIGGQTTTQIRARLQTDLLDALTTLGVTRARILVGGGTNDLPGLQTAMQTSEAAGITTAQATWANLAAMYDAVRAAGHEPIGRTLPPRTSFTSQIAMLNAGIRRLCERRGMACLDLYSVLAATDGAGGYKAGYSPDGVHPALGPGLRAIADLANSVLAPYFPLASPPWDGTNNAGHNLIANGLFTQDANSDGVGDNWTFSGSTGTTTASIETGDANIFGNWQVMTTSVQGSSSWSIAQFLGSNTTGRWAVGDVLEFSCLISTTSEAGGFAPTVRLSYGNGSPYSVEAAVYRLLPDLTRGRVYRRCVVPSGATSLSVTVINSENSPRGTGVVKVAEMALYNLTRLGIA